MYRLVARSITSSTVTTLAAEEDPAAHEAGEGSSTSAAGGGSVTTAAGVGSDTGVITTSRPPTMREAPNLHPRPPPHLRRPGRPRLVALGLLEGWPPPRSSIPPQWRRQGLVGEARSIPPSQRPPPAPLQSAPAAARRSGAGDGARKIPLTHSTPGV
jgi:hypothetical protein